MKPQSAWRFVVTDPRRWVAKRNFDRSESWGVLAAFFLSVAVAAALVAYYVHAR